MDPAQRPMSENVKVRWAILLLISFAMATNYYFYDALSPLKDLLTTKLGYSSSDYGFFISAYSIPNVFLAMAVVGGIILDRIGIRITGAMFFSSMVAGSFLTYYGSTEYFNSGGFGYEFMGSFLTDYSPALKVMSVGFFMFGLGAETTCVVVSKVVVKWFKGRELALALGLNIAIAMTSRRNDAQGQLESESGRSNEIFLDPQNSICAVFNDVKIFQYRVNVKHPS